MFYQKLEVIIAITAALITTVISILRRDSLYAYSIKFTVVVIAFYILGKIAKTYFEKKLFYKEPEKDGDEETGEEPGEDED